MNMRLRTATAIVAMGLASGASHAQGIPVIDVANLIQAIQQVMNDVTKIENQVQQIRQLEAQVASMNGSRGLGSAIDSPALRNYVPATSFQSLNDLDSAGYGGLSPEGRALRDAHMVYNCMDLVGTARASCQSSLAKPYEEKAILEGAARSASGRAGARALP